jgi:uncharacterized LabA/DUF88 family protein
MVADELRRQADHFIELSDLAQHISRAGGENAARRLREESGEEEMPQARPLKNAV